MRIAFFVDQFPCLSETFILNPIVGLIDRGHQVDIYAERQGSTEKVHPEVESYKLLDRTHYTGMPAKRSLRLLKAIGLLLANFHKNPKVLLRSLNLLKYNFSNYGEQAKLLKLFYSAIPLLGKAPYDIIHCHYGRNGLRGTLLRNIGAIQGKLVTSFYGYDVSQYPREYGKDIYQELFEKGEFYTGISSFIIKKAVAIDCPPDKIVKLPLGVDLSKYIFQPRTIEPGDKIKLITVARLVEKKGIEYSIEAISKIAANYPNIEYRIVGDGILRELLQKKIDRLNLSAQVKLLGWKTQDEVRQLYADSHIFILASVTAADGDEEGQGLVLQEAQAMGLPVIATLHNGFPDSVLDGKSAFLVPERDVDALADKIGYLIQHPQVWPEMGHAGRAYVEENFDIKKLDDRLVEIYQKLIS